MLSPLFSQSLDFSNPSAFCGIFPQGEVEKFFVSGGFAVTNNSQTVRPSSPHTMPLFPLLGLFYLFIKCIRMSFVGIVSRWNLLHYMRVF